MAVCVTGDNDQALNVTKDEMRGMSRLPTPLSAQLLAKRS